MILVIPQWMFIFIGMVFIVLAIMAWRMHCESPDNHPGSPDNVEVKIFCSGLLLIGIAGIYYGVSPYPFLYLWIFDIDLKYFIPTFQVIP